MENFWDQRYSEPGFVYGKNPNGFFRQVLDGMQPGKILLPGEGEGRHAVYAASNQWEVMAFDQSVVARDKAMAWAESEELKIDYLLGDMVDFSCNKPDFDLVAIIYVHFPSSIRQQIHRKLAACLKPGGIIIMECFHKTQLKYETGGPAVEELLYLEDDLRGDFSQLEIIRCEHLIVYKKEGKYHAGESSVIRFIAKNQIQ